MSIQTLILILLGVAAGTAFGYFLRWMISLGKRGSMELQIKQMELSAREDAKKVIAKAEEKAELIIKEKTSDFKEKEQAHKKTEDRLIRKEELLDKRQGDIDAEAEKVDNKKEQVEEKINEADALIVKRNKRLEELAEMDTEEAKKELLDAVEKESEEVIVNRIHKLEQFGEERLEKKARDILVTAIHRMGNSIPTDVIATTVKLPNDEIKGKIIGKEGRNIRAFERESGVDVIVDDTPGTITISSFDPVRRQVARVALENLILDGRIQPVKIEEAVEKARGEIGRIIAQKGADAALVIAVSYIIQVQSAAWYVKLTDTLFGPPEKEKA